MVMTWWAENWKHLQKSGFIMHNYSDNKPQPPIYFASLGYNQVDRETDNLPRFIWALTKWVKQIHFPLPQSYNL